MDLLEENIKQLKVVVQIQNLKKVDQNGDEFEEMTIPALREKLDVFLEVALQNVLPRARGARNSCPKADTSSSYLVIQAKAW